MLRADKFIAKDKKVVEEAIAEAEKRTAAEITCAVATESGRYDRAEAVIGIVMALLGLWVAHLAVGAAAGGTGSAAGAWDAGTASLPLQLAGVMGGFLLGNLLASFVHGIRRVAVRRREMVEEVDRSAAHVFHDKRLASTRARAGVLIYLSLFERRMVVLADQGALDVLGQQGVEALRDIGIDKLKAGQRGGALVATIEAAAERLVEALPVEQDDADELTDELLIYHPRP